MKYVSGAYGDPGATQASNDRFIIERGRQNEAFHARWRGLRQRTTGYADPAHPFLHQGSADINLYKAFLETAHSLLHKGGRLGYIIPSGIYSDQGSGALRKLFLDCSQWEWLFNFINWKKIFPSVYYRFKFNVVIVEKGGKTRSISAAFVRTRIEDWETAELAATPYARSQVLRFSPKSKAILEVQSQRDLEILEKIYSDSVLLGAESGESWGVTYEREFDMTNDSKLFASRARWEEQGYRADEYGRWLKGEWRPIDQLWTEVAIEASQCAQSDFPLRQQQPPYDSLPVLRNHIPPGIILARDGNTWIHEDHIDQESFKDANGSSLVLRFGRGRESIPMPVKGAAIALPLYEGRMIGQFDFSSKGWVSGRGRSATWRDIAWSQKNLEPQFMMAAPVMDLYALNRRLDKIRVEHGDEFYERELKRLGNAATLSDGSAISSCRVAFMDVASATNERTMIATITGTFPHGNSVPVLTSTKSATALSGLLNSLAFDFAARARCGGLHLNWFVVEETAIPLLDQRMTSTLATLVRRLAACSPLFALDLLRDKESSDKAQWALTRAERTRIRVQIESICAYLFGLDVNDLAYIIAQCDLPVEMLKSGSIDLAPRGFWRIDQTEPPELRLPVLALIGFHDLETKIFEHGGDRDAGIESFLTQNDGEGWLLPETLRLADYGLGHDARALEHQPVAGRLGPRFYDWQLAQSAEESWRECHLHARNLLGEAGYQSLLAEIEAERTGQTVAASPPPAVDVPLSDDQQLQLFS